MFSKWIGAQNQISEVANWCIWELIPVSDENGQGCNYTDQNFNLGGRLLPKLSQVFKKLTTS